MATTDSDKSDLERHREELRREEAKATRQAAIRMARTIPISLALCAVFYHVTHHDVREHETWAAFSGDCANIRTELSPDKRAAKVILPPGCHYTNSNY